MFRLLARLLINTIAAMLAAYLLKGVHLQDVATAFMVAVVLALLNTFIKPLLVILTIPITVVTLGLFLIVINVLIIQWTANLVTGFRVDNWLWALLFSFVMSLVSSLLEIVFGTKQKTK